MSRRALRYPEATRAALERVLRPSWKRRYVSPVLLDIHRELLPRFTQLARGGFWTPGAEPCRSGGCWSPRVSRCESLDIAPQVPGGTILADLRALPFQAACYHGVLCSEGLEHLSNPEQALSELYRLLLSGGRLILSVPFLARLHEEPHGYFPYTCHGLGRLLTGAGFRVIEIVPTCGVLRFLGHQFPTVLLTTTYAVSVVRQLALGINALLITLPCYWLDRMSGLAPKLPAGYVAVATKD